MGNPQLRTMRPFSMGEWLQWAYIDLLWKQNNTDLGLVEKYRIYIYSNPFCRSIDRSSLLFSCLLIVLWDVVIILIIIIH